MKFFAILFCVGFAQSGLVRREAEAEADAKAGNYAAASAPICHSVPEKTCTPRQIEKPKKVCHEEHDEIVDTTITEHCEEIITTKCEQTSQQSRHSSGVIGHDSKIVATGVIASPERVVSYGHISSGVGASYGSYGGSAAGVGATYGSYGGSSYRKREADADAEPEADADAEAAGAHGYSSGIVKSAPICRSVPVKNCNKVPVSTPRKVSKTVCKEVVDIEIIEDCKEVITTHCEQTSQKVHHHSNVVGHDTRVGPSAVVASHAHAAVASPVVASYGASSYGATGYANGYGKSLGPIRRFGGGRY